MKLLSVFATALLATAAAPASALGKPAIVLVHGAWETADIWTGVAEGLKKDGYKVTAVALPGRPGNPAPANQVTLSSYQQAVAAVIARQIGPVVLVGHSFGGFVIAAEAEAEPTKVKTLVFVAAYLPKDGQSLLGLANTDAGSKAGPAIVVDKLNGVAAIKYEARAGLFANDAPAAIGDLVAKSIVDEPLGPLATPVHLTTDNFGSSDKVYVHTTRDQVVSPPFQQRMIADTPVRLELSVPTGHTPFITDPAGLVVAIEKAAG